MLDWMKMKRRISTAIPVREPEAEPAKPQGRTMSGKYRLLYKYLEDRYAKTVVLTFGEIEDLLGFSLPDQARLSEGGGRTHRMHRFRTKLLRFLDACPQDREAESTAHTVVFERLP